MRYNDGQYMLFRHLNIHFNNVDSLNWIEISQRFGNNLKQSTSVNVFQSPDLAKWCPYVVRIWKNGLLFCLQHFVIECILRKIRKTQKKQMYVASWCCMCFCVVLCVSFCTGHFVMVPLNLTYLHCLFEHLFHLYYIFNLNGLLHTL